MNGHQTKLTTAKGALIVGALGVVFGDIGTSPLYALQTVFSLHHHAVAPTEADVLGVISMVTWCLLIIVTGAYRWRYGCCQWSARPASVGGRSRGLA